MNRPMFQSLWIFSLGLFSFLDLSALDQMHKHLYIYLSGYPFENTHDSDSDTFYFTILYKVNIDTENEEKKLNNKKE